MSYTNGLDNPELYHQTKIYSGDGNDDRDIVFDVTDTSMQPNMLWSARRDSGDNLSIYDSVRGDGKELRTAESGGEYDRSDNIQALNSNGFQVGTDGQVNASGGTYVSWGWKESATAGFDIVSYTGNGSNRTIAHSLSATPDLVITKRRDNTGNWMVGGSTTLGGDNKLLLLDTTAALDDNSEVYQSFSSSTFGIGVNAYINTDTSTYISYLFSGKQGYSKFSSFEGSGNADGPFCWCGMKPAFVLIRNVDSVEGWHIFDNKRNGHNADNTRLYPHSAEAEADASHTIDMLSNGFKVRSATEGLNKSGDTIIYAAFSEAPFVNSKSVPCNAR